MQTYFAILAAHLIAAAIWVGGHLLLALSVLPSALKYADVNAITEFEARFERLGLPALAAQIVTGLALALHIRPDIGGWFSFEDPIARAILAKLGLLVATILLAAHARLTIIPKLDATRLPALGIHIAAVTLLSVAFVLTGLAFRLGGIGG